MIRQTAYNLFEEKGYHQTTMRELARRAGVGLGTIFKHYPDKKALLLAAFEEDLLEVTEQGFASLPEKDLKAQLVHLVRGYYHFYARRPSLSRVMLRALIAAPDASGQKIQRQYLSFMSRAAELFRAAAERGEIRADVDPLTGAIGFWAFYSNALFMGLAGPIVDVDVQTALFERLLDLFFTGLAGN